MQSSMYNTARTLLWDAFETTNNSKIWSLYSFEGFLPYKRNIAKITKVTNANQKHTEEYI